MADKPKEESGTVRKIEEGIFKTITGIDLGAREGIIVALMAYAANTFFSGKGDGVDARTIEDETFFDYVLNLLRAAGPLGILWADCLERLNEIARKIHAIYGVNLRMSLLVGLGEKAEKIMENLEKVKADMAPQVNKDEWLKTTQKEPIALIKSLMEKIKQHLPSPHTLETATPEDLTAALKAVVKDQIETERWPGNLKTKTLRKIDRFMNNTARSERFKRLVRKQQRKARVLENKPAMPRWIIAGVSVLLILAFLALIMLTPERPPRGRDLVQEGAFYGQQQIEEAQSEIEQLIEEATQ